MGKRMPLKIMKSPTKLPEPVLPVLNPPQNVPLSVSQQEKPREDQKDMLPYRFHIKPDEHYTSPDKHEEAIQQQAKRDARDKKRLCVERRALYVGILGLVGLYATFEQTRRQADTARDTFVAAQRASVSLALESGKFMEQILVEDKQWRTGEKQQQIVVYLRNYGVALARNVVIETWIIHVFPSHPSQKERFPAFLREKVIVTKGPGADIPPGFLFKWRIPNTPRVSSYDRSKLQIIGRISYFDGFDEHKPRCEDFTAEYEPNNAAFILRTGHALCDGRTREILFCYGDPITETEHPGDNNAIKVECGGDSIKMEKVK